MAVLLSSRFCSSAISSASVSAALPSASLPSAAANRCSRFQKNHVLPPIPFSSIKIPIAVAFEKRKFMVMASPDNSGSDGASLDLPLEGPQESGTLENLPLESKLKETLEQKLRMKLAKKIRLRRKRLVRKRHLRKIGRWPPSKMKKNKNV